MSDELEVTIMGKEYSFITDNNKKEARLISRFVDNEAKEIKENNPYSSDSTIAILTALNIADKLFKLARNVDRLAEIVD